MKLFIVGAGGAGGYFGARWAQAGLNVTLLARGAHLRAMQESGLKILSPHGDFTATLHAVDDPAEARSADVVVFATKTWQLRDAIAQVGPHIAPDATVFGLQNGVEASTELARALPKAHVLGATCRIISMIASPGEIHHLGIEPSMSIGGEPNGGVSESAEALRDALHLEGLLSVTASNDIELDIWRKFLFFAPMSGVGSLVRRPIGEIRNVEESRRLLQFAMGEVLALANARGIPLLADSVVQTMGFVDSVPANGSTSMQRDFADGRRSELEALAGAVSRMGAAAGVPTPVHDFIYAALLPQERHAIASA